MTWREAGVAIVVALIGTGILGPFLDALKSRRRRRAQSGREPAAIESMHIANADASLLTVVRARDELEADNARLLATLREERQQHDLDRHRWNAERDAMRDEIEALESKLRRLLEELSELKERAQHLGEQGSKEER